MGESEKFFLLAAHGRSERRLTRRKRERRTTTIRTEIYIYIQRRRRRKAVSERERERERDEYVCEETKEWERGEKSRNGGSRKCDAEETREENLGGACAA